jgi:hypothetical protein
MNVSVSGRESLNGAANLDAIRWRVRQTGLKGREQQTLFFGVHLGSNKNFRGLLWAVLVAIRAA